MQSNPETAVLHIDEGLFHPCTGVCQARYTISASLPKRVGTCFENCCVDGAKHGKEQQHGQAGRGARGTALEWGKYAKCQDCHLKEIFRTPPFLEKNFSDLLCLNSLCEQAGSWLCQLSL